MRFKLSKAFISTVGVLCSLFPGVFAAKAAPAPEAFSQAPIISGFSATLRGTLLPGGAPTTAWFEWGTNGNLTFSTPATNLGAGSRVIQIELSAGTIPRGQLLHGRMVASNAFGITRTPEFPFGIGKVVRGWGANSYGQANSPSSLSNTVAVSAGGWHGLALQNDGLVKSWGGNFQKQADVPGDLANVVSLDSGPAASMAATRGGLVREWGVNGVLLPITTPSGIDHVLGGSQGASGASVVRDDGVCLSWRYMVSTSSPATNSFPGTSNFVAVSTGPEVIGIRIDRTIAWSAAPYPISNIVSVAWGAAHVLMLKDDGTVIGFGLNNVGQLNIPPDLSNVVAITSGNYHGVALKKDGSVVAWGDNSQGQLDIPPDLKNVIAVSAEGSFGQFTVALVANGIPSSKPVTVTEAIGRDVLVELAGSDRDGDAISFRVKSLPTHGTLYQFDNGGRGAVINVTNTLMEPVGGSPGMLVYAPTAFELGTPADTFSFATFDGSDESVPALATINVVPAPYIKQTTWNAVTKEAGLVFSGVVGVSDYTIMGSTNLIDWMSLGSPAALPANNWRFEESGLGNTPVRFYQVVSP